ncbi:hypothetical protein ACFQZS_05180 [Mucilaginibacter calamicampi]|uniref:Uncharacterized protein n=1 Tax=Mucilaginibacter calamicampi TaxID=1302352 RepID=A0ABW2YY99_9SPHI
MKQFISILILTISSLCVNAQKLPSKQEVSLNAPSNVKIDGKLIDSGTDTVRLSAIDGIERLGQNPLVLIDGVQYDKEILYKISTKCIRGNMLVYANNGDTEYGEKGKDGIVEIKTHNKQITYLTANEKQYLLKKEEVKGLFFSRFTYTDNDGRLRDEARIRRANGGGSSGDLAPGGKIAFVIKDKVYNEAEFKRLFPVDNAEYGTGIRIGSSAGRAKERGLNLEGYDLVFDFNSQAEF